MFDSLRFNLQKRKIKVIVWDIDGTLYQSEGLGNAIVQHYLSYLSKTLRFTPDRASKLFYAATEEMGRWSLAMSKLCNKPEEFFIWQIENNIQKHKFIKYNSSLVRALGLLHKYRHFIVTNGTETNARRILRTIGFSFRGNRVSPFEKIFAFDQTGYLKPNSLAFQQVITYTKEHPWQHLVVGDNISSDIIPAKNLRMKTVIVGSRNHTADFSFVSINRLLEKLVSFS